METVLRRFKLHEIEKHLFHHFTQKSWDDIVDKFGESEVPVNTRTIAHFFCKAARKMNATNLFELGEICSLFGKCGVFKVSVNSIRKKCRGFSYCKIFAEVLFVFKTYSMSFMNIDFSRHAPPLSEENVVPDGIIWW